MIELERILAKCKKGDEKAQRILFAQMKSSWMGVAVRYMKDTDAAKDVFQEAALKILTDISSLKDFSAFGGWARKIIVNTALNHLKQKQSYLFALQEHHATENLVLESGDEEIIGKLDHEKLLVIIGDMPDGYRMVFNLFLIEGYSHQEIAAMMNISESTSRSQLTKAKQYLKRVLENLKKSNHEKVVGF
jgi:RNA polymerase sigma factor (sigma-70 family)